MVPRNYYLSAVVVAAMVTLMFGTLTSASSTTTEATNSTESSTDSSSTMVSSTTTTAMPSYITCFTGSCAEEKCVDNITEKCNSTTSCKIQRTVNTTSTYYELSCVNASCSTTSNRYCCTTNDCNQDETKFSGSGHQLTSSGILHILTILATLFVTRQAVMVGE